MQTCDSGDDDTQYFEDLSYNWIRGDGEGQ